MDSNVIREALHAQPFRPFTLRLSDGRTFQVVHPDYVAVGSREVAISGPRDGGFSLLELSLVTELEYTGTEPGDTLSANGIRRNGNGEASMTDKQLLDRIVVNPAVMTGKPVIRGTRLTVPFILGLLARGTTSAEIVAEYKGLTEVDIQACLAFARESLEHTSFMPLVPETV